MNDADNFLKNLTPLEIFKTWFEEAKTSGLKDPNAMVLSTVDAGGAPSSRVVLLKEFTSDGFIFYTNYDSKKGQDLATQNVAAANFFWDPLYRQVSFRGRTEKTPREISEKYWKTRIRASQLSQWVSSQSHPLSNRAHMENLIREADKQFHGQDIPCPAHWGGYFFRPTYVEFWIGGDGRFHDRFSYQKVENHWRGQRLYP